MSKAMQMPTTCARAQLGLVSCTHRHFSLDMFEGARGCTPLHLALQSFSFALLGVNIRSDEKQSIERRLVQVSSTDRKL